MTIIGNTESSAAASTSVTTPLSKRIKTATTRCDKKH